MKGYVIVDTEIVDQEAYAEFIAQAPGLIEANGGRFLVRTSDVEAVEGGWTPKRLVIMEFDSPEAARGFLASDGYTALTGVRHRAAGGHSRIVVAEGCDPGA